MGRQGIWDYLKGPFGAVSGFTQAVERSLSSSCSSSGSGCYTGPNCRQHAAPRKRTARFKSKPMQVEEFLPYRESMVGFVYDVRRVLAGKYNDEQILIMHPAYIGLKQQSLRKYQIGRTYTLRLHELEGTPWGTVKRRDDSGRIDLQPYITVEDEAKYPGSTRTA